MKVFVGLSRYIRYFLPYSEKEMSILIEHAAHPWLRTFLKQNTKDNITRMIYSATGGVPRHFSLLMGVIEVSLKTIDNNNTQPLILLRQFISKWEEDFTSIITRFHAQYLQKMDPSVKLPFLGALLDVLTFNCRHDQISAGYLDLSLIYYDGKIYRPLCPAIGLALRNNLAAQNLPINSLAQHDCMILLNKNQENDEKGRALERVIFKQLILNGTTELQTVDLYGNNAEMVKFECGTTYSFEKAEILPDTIFSNPTFMIPKSKDQPVLDAICVTPSHVIALQVTVSPCSLKIPDKTSPSSSLYDDKRWKLQNKDGKYTNLTENLMALAGVDTTVTLLPPQNPSKEDISNHKVHTIKNLNIVDKNTQKACGVAFSYVIFSSQPYDGSFLRSKSVPNFPWVRFVCGKNLEPLVASEIITALLKP